MKLSLLLNSILAVGTVLAIFDPFAAIANTPRGTSGINTGSEVAPPRPRIPLPSSSNYHHNETIGELRLIITERAIPPGEAGVQPERPGFVRIDLKREGSIPSSIAERLSAYINHLNAQRGEFTVFGSDRRGVNHNIQVTLTPKLNRQIEVRFKSDSKQGVKSTDRSVTVPNIKAAAVLAGVLTALDAGNASGTTLDTATKMIVSLGNINLTRVEIQQLSQGIVETLLAGEGAFSGCGGNISVSDCKVIDYRALAAAIRAYNQIVMRSNDQVLAMLVSNSEFQTLGERLRQARSTVKTSQR